MVGSEKKQTSSPHPMRRNVRIFHSLTIASAGRARMRGRLY